jgi:sugar phosphate isomerase/epimerase
MSRISINEITTYHWSFLEDVTGFAAAGIDGIGVWRRKLSDFGEERGALLLRDCGLAVSAVWSAGGFTGSDGHSFRDAVDDALEALRTAAEIRAGCLVVVSGGRAGHTLGHARRLVVDALCELGDAAAGLGLDVALCPIAPWAADRTSFLRGTLDGLEIVDRCGHAHVGIVLDLNRAAGESALEARWNDLARATRVVRVCGRSLSAGEELSPEDAALTARVLASLDAAGYRGWYDVQVVCEKSWKSDYNQLIGRCRHSLLQLAPLNAASQLAISNMQREHDALAARNGG